MRQTLHRRLARVGSFELEKRASAAGDYFLPEAEMGTRRVDSCARQSRIALCRKVNPPLMIDMPTRRPHLAMDANGIPPIQHRE